MASEDRESTNLRVYIPTISPVDFTIKLAEVIQTTKFKVVLASELVILLWCLWKRVGSVETCKAETLASFSTVDRLLP